jgi:hypothetical protein
MYAQTAEDGTTQRQQPEDKEMRREVIKEFSKKFDGSTVHRTVIR